MGTVRLLARALVPLALIGTTLAFAPAAIAATMVVTSTADDGPGTLRAAITAAEQTGVADEIRFAIPGSGYHVIALHTPLPKIKKPLAIDGTTQPGFAGSPLVVVSGTHAGHGNGLTIAGPNVSVKGLVINGFDAGAGINVNVATSPSHVVIQGNFIGTTGKGTAAAPNREGVVVRSGSATIGGTSRAARNVISGNTLNGVDLSSDGTYVRGNYIGTDATGTHSVRNENGVEMYTLVHNVIGGPGAKAGNVISGNESNGVLVLNAPNGGFVVQGNRIGTNAAGTGPLSNGSSGVFVSNTTGGLVGGTKTGQGNVFSHDSVGVSIASDATHVRILGNSISASRFIGVNLIAPGDPVAGVTPNDLDDADTGANGLQNYPVLTHAFHHPDGTEVQGSLNSLHSTTFRVEFFTSGSCDPTGYGEGRTFLGSAQMATDAGGDHAFDVTVSGVAKVGSIVTATATGPDGTSEFGACVAVS